MVKPKDEPHILPDGSIDLKVWLDHLNQKKPHIDLQIVRNACHLSELSGQDRATETGESCLQQGLAMAEILAELDMDHETLAAAIIYDSVRYSELSIEDVYEQLGKNVGKLVAGVLRTNAIEHMQHFNPATVHHQQLDNIRKMILAMADDVRIVLIKLSERLRVLRTIGHLSDAIKKYFAKETIEIYAPLANRLGIGQIKWEMEDLSFYYLEPEKYKAIAKDLNVRRVVRDKYVKKIVKFLKKEINKIKIKHFDVYGRSKHIHSIHNKMQRKKVNINQIYDATAVRVLVPTTEDCYKVLGIVHQYWQQIPSEFDDYIVHPKPNGYRSLHTAVIGPEEKHFEVQIRTHQMHAEAELGVAAHWRYKEHHVQPQLKSHEKRIQWLREVLDWQKDVAKTGGVPTPIENEFLEDRIYVFTPSGDILDLPRGATPLDFAYHIHSDIGNHCKGAKVNGHIIPLNHTLNTGEQVEILTAKDAKPSRDWLNPHLGYLKSSRAKAKVHHWFKLQNYDQNKHEGWTLLEEKISSLGLKDINYHGIAQKFNFKKSDDLFAALGRGDVGLNQILNQITGGEKNEQLEIQLPHITHIPQKTQTGIHIQGMSNLLNYIAKCCQPMPGDPIIGFITIGRGIAVHHQDCRNINNIQHPQQSRLIEVSWAENIELNYPVSIYITADEKSELVKDIILVLSHQNAKVVSLNTCNDPKTHLSYIDLVIEAKNSRDLERLLVKINQLDAVVTANRSSI